MYFVGFSTSREISVIPVNVSWLGSSVNDTCCELGFASFSITNSLAFAAPIAKATLTVKRLLRNIVIPRLLLLETTLNRLFYAHIIRGLDILTVFLNRVIDYNGDFKGK